MIFRFITTLLFIVSISITISIFVLNIDILTIGNTPKDILYADYDEKNNLSFKDSIFNEMMKADTTQLPSKNFFKSRLISCSNWDTFTELKYKKEIIDYHEVSVPVYSQNMENLRNKEITISGYIIPLENTELQNRILLSQLPINESYYCGKSKGVAEMIEVSLTKPIKYTDTVITIKGTVDYFDDPEYFTLQLNDAYEIK